MNCFFCSKPLIDTDETGILDCETCTNKTRYVCSGSMLKLEVWYVHVRIDPFLVEWDLEVPETRIFTGPIYKEDKFLMLLDNPLPYSQEEVTNLVTRLKNLKAFL